MPVPSVIGDISTTPSLNSPAGSDNLSTTDDYLRAIQGIVKTVYDAQTTINSAQTTINSAQTTINSAQTTTNGTKAAKGANSDITSLTGLTGETTIKGAALLGYGTGAGGSVTQLTSKATAVTLNKPTGRVVTNNAALASGASVSFIVNNSLVNQEDVPVVTVYAGSSYAVNTMAVNTGQFSIRIVNITAGSLSEAIPISFAIIKGVIA